MYAEAGLVLERHNHALTIPTSAVDGAADETSGQVAVVTPDNRIEMRKVQLGLQTESEVEVRSGLKQGDAVVTGSRANLRAGQEVRTKDGNAEK